MITVRVLEALTRTLETRWFGALLGISAIYFLVTARIAARRLLWNDELFTLYISRLPHMADVWGALLSGGEQLPPLFNLLTRASLAVFGENGLALRLPEIIGFWGMCVCLFVVVSRRAGRLCGLVAFLLPLVTTAYNYAYEARPYGIVLGLSALALLCWQEASDHGPRRNLAVVGLAMALAGALSNHYYAIFIFLALGVGELARTVARRRLDNMILAAFLVGLTPLLIFWPLIRQARAYGGGFWSPAQWSQISGFYYALLSPLALPLIGALLLLFLVLPTLSFADERNAAQKKPGQMPVHEIAAAVGFALLPVAAVAAGKLVTGAFTDRYALPAVIGFSILLALAIPRLVRRPAEGSALLIGFLTVAFLLVGVRTYRMVAADQAQQAQTNQLLTEFTPEPIPIVVADAQTFLTLAYYGPPAVTRRLIYLADPERSRKYLGFDSVEKGMSDLLKPWFHLDVRPYRSFLAAGKAPDRAAGGDFYVFGSNGSFLNWLFSDLPTQTGTVQIRARQGDFLLLEVGSGRRSLQADTPKQTREEERG